MTNNNNLKMTWDTYAHIKSLLEAEKTCLHNEYLIANEYIGINTEYASGREKICNCYMDRLHNIETMILQLRYAAGMSVGQNISKEMKEFWGLPTE